MFNNSKLNQMKNKTIATATVLSALTLQMFAGHNTQQRSNCTLKKYTANAAVWAPGATFSHWNTDKGCTWAEAVMSSSSMTGGTDGNGNAYAQSLCHIGNDGFWVGGWANGGWQRGEDVSMIPSVLSYSPMIASKNGAKKNYTRDGYKGDAIVFDEVNRTISIKNLTAYLTISSTDLKNDYSTIQFKIFSEVIKNGQSVPVKTLWSAKASIINGELVLEGDFKQGEFSKSVVLDETTFSLAQTTKTIHISDDVDFESLVVDLSGDSGNLGMGAPEATLPNLSSIEGKKVIENIQAETSFNFDVINKKSTIELNITKNTIAQSIEEVCILTFEGNVVKPISLSANNSSQIVNVADLTSGKAYLVRYLIDGNYYTKKFIL